uniref:Uncharacterized protein n=1 Tax=Trichobilharzia regenti TaxID=157069 RepID=A0AA85KBQ0_TRIRE|nr:unnamed protein product [Trichobilharzia regenti]
MKNVLIKPLLCNALLKYNKWCFLRLLFSLHSKHRFCRLIARENLDKILGIVKNCVENDKSKEEREIHVQYFCNYLCISCIGVERNAGVILL